MRTLSDFDQLISDIKSVMAMDPPPARVEAQGGVVVGASYLKERAINAADFMDRIRGAGFAVDPPQYNDFYLIHK